MLLSLHQSPSEGFPRTLGEMTMSLERTPTRSLVIWAYYKSSLADTTLKESPWFRSQTLKSMTMMQSRNPKLQGILTHHAEIRTRKSHLRKPRVQKSSVAQLHDSRRSPPINNGLVSSSRMGNIDIMVGRFHGSQQRATGSQQHGTHCGRRNI